MVIKMDEMEIIRIKEFVKDMDKAQKIIYYEVKRKNVGLAVFLSIIIPGGGHMYLEKVGKGVILFILVVILMVLGSLLTIVLIGFLLLLVTIIIWVYIIYDAYKSAKSYNSQLYSIIFGED